MQLADVATIHKSVSAHTLRDNYARHLLQAGTNIHTIQEMLGHRELDTTVICTHVLRVRAGTTASPWTH
ncbi:MAG: tyrosine-type recombinase/integrase [Hylemonella sp.]|uniref:tyrosine-type recombinase/integrase n=1 Tax=Hylemonella sp. TaxID=2066020 RepID=UPI00391D18B0